VVAKCLDSFVLRFLPCAVLAGSFSFASPGSASGSASVTSKPYPYTSGKDQFEGILSRPSAKQDTRGAVLVVHNWMGVTDETKKQAERFASLGFVALSVDVYGKGVRPKNAEEAGRLAGIYKQDRKLFLARMDLGLDALRKLPELKGKPIFAAGYCFGGTGVIEMAKAGAAIEGVFSFHGGLDAPTTTPKGQVKARVVAFHGADDPYVSAEDLAAFEKDMVSSASDWQLIKFGKAVHSFTDLGAGSDPSKGAAYDALADLRSFEMTRVLLDEWTAKTTK
jgi:dienelactone hydrolase